ncbi:MAG: carbohydrate kinase family protein [Candidatus Altiarchaeia archaeon]
MKEKVFDVVGFGALNLDKLYRVGRIAKTGEHMPILGVTESPGGSAANTIAGLARLGARCGFIGAVGNDAEGKIMLEDFKKFSVDTCGVSVLEDARTGIIIGFVDSKGERTLYPYPGANSMLATENIDYSYAEKARFLHVTSFVDSKQMPLQKRLVAELEDVKLSFSPGDLYVKKGMKALMPFIKKSSAIFLNADEATQLTGEKYKEACLRLTDKGAGIVAVTLGGKGSYVTDGERSFEVPACKTRAVDTTGAGDAFAAGFLYRLLKGSPIDAAARCGNFAAACCIREPGARCGLAGREDLEKF